MKKNSFAGKVFVTNNFEETRRLGKGFGKILEGGNVIALYGDLGSGKTTFVQGLAEGLGIKKRIISPTFIIVRSYKVKSQKSKVKNASKNSKVFYHIDLYRVESENDLRALGIEEILENKNAIIVVEWAEKLKSKMPAKRIDIEFFHRADNVRKIMFRSLNQ